jgi:hypothetical protein
MKEIYSVNIGGFYVNKTMNIGNVWILDDQG